VRSFRFMTAELSEGRSRPHFDAAVASRETASK
jgi:hypothetical protein